MNIRIWVSLAVICAGLSACAPERATVEKTVGKNRIAIGRYLEAHLTAVVEKGNQVVIASDGKLGVIDDRGEWQKEVVLGIGDRFRTQPDHHASTTFELKEMNAAGIVIGYSAHFDHSAFGKALITIDEGEMNIDYRRAID